MTFSKDLFLNRLMAGEDSEALAKEIMDAFNSAVDEKKAHDEEVARKKAEEEAARKAAEEEEAKRRADEEAKKATARKYLEQISDATYNYLKYMYPELNFTEESKISVEELERMMEETIATVTAFTPILFGPRTKSFKHGSQQPHFTITIPEEAPVEKEVKVKKPTDDEIITDFFKAFGLQK